MNSSSSRIIVFSGIFLLSLFVSYIIFSSGDRDRNVEEAENRSESDRVGQAAEIEQTVDIEIIGTWQSEPILGQLGLIQSTYTFNADGTYSNKLDMISFCDESMGQDCEYFWMIFDGTYSVKNGVITLSVKEDKKVKLGKGQSKPEIRIDASNPRTDKYMVELDAGNLVMTGIKDNESVTYKHFISMEQDDVTSSDDAHNVEHNADIVGVWQSEPYVWNSTYIQSSYTFKNDDSYSNEVDFLRICKDVPEQNCEYYRMYLDGTYAVVNGVMTLFTKEVRTEILRKGQSKPDILFAPDRPIAGEEYTVKLDAGKLFMTGVTSNETVVFKPKDND